ncbi:MAG: hypothetical protein EAZ54_07320, partial [Curvibacter sp.]
LAVATFLLRCPAVAQPRFLELAAAGVQIGHNYPAPVVDHAQARARTLARYGFLKKSAGQGVTTAVQ